MTKRVGAARRDAIPADVLSRLNDGTLESATLAEGLAVDFRTLLRARTAARSLRGRQADAPGLALARRLWHSRPLADDPHFGVREWAWLAARGAIAAAPAEATRLLTPWATDGSANVRRFASVGTRPRGVWCPHIDLLKAEPELGLPLRSDPSKYVRDSMANWLNDAGKSEAEWVRGVCRRWGQESPTPETRYIVARACRNL